MIRFLRLKKYYEDTKALEDITFRIKKGDIFGLVGRSGAGKSTLLSCINGLENYDEGSLIVDGQEVNTLNEKELRFLRRKVGMIFQHFSLTERDTVYQNVALPMKCWKCDKQTIEEKVNKLLRIVELEDKKERKPRELSGGQKQRVAIARALAMEPQILLCDEATSSLDPNTTQSILDLLKKINKQFNLTIVVVTHEISVIREICNKVAILENGHIAAIGNVEDVFLNQPPALIKLLGDKRPWKIPLEGINIKMLFSNNKVGKNILSLLVKETDVDFDIIWANMENYRMDTLAEFIINLTEDASIKVKDYLSKANVRWEEIGSDERYSRDPYYS